MVAPRRLRPSVATQEAGFTLIEMLIAAAMSLVLIGALVAMLTSVLASQPKTAERSAQIQDARVMLERMVRELRQGKAVPGSSGTATTLTVDAYTRAGCGTAPPTATATPCRITYSCSASGSTSACTRRSGSGTPATVLTGLASPEVFSYGSTTSPTCEASTTPTPRFVCLRLAYPAEDGESVTLEDSAYLRNSAA